LKKAQYFFTDIKKEGVVLYDSGNFQLKEARELLPAERKKLAQEDFSYWFHKAEKLMAGFQFYLDTNDYNEAAFLLHQATERLYSGILLVFTRYKPNTHDLNKLRDLTNAQDSRFIRIFPLSTSEEIKLFELLCKSYVDARYKPSYVITKNELDKLMKEVKKLKELAETLCQERIESYV
jgi:HEPN domain-containing protein